MEYFIMYLLAVNVFAVFLTIKDKYSAKRGSWRVSERTLLLVSALGGSVGMFLTMKIIRHKTKHLKFMIGIPAIMAAQTVVIFLAIHMGNSGQ